MSGSIKNCLFCNIPKERVVAENALAYAIRDGFPVTEGHTLIIPKRHVTDYFGLSQEELLACNDLLNTMKQLHQNHEQPQPPYRFQQMEPLLSTMGPLVFAYSSP